MTEASENLVEYREMLILHTEDETYEHRVSSLFQSPPLMIPLMKLCSVLL